MKKIKGYLERLSFDSKLSNTFVAKYLVNTRIISLILIAIIGLGTFGFTNLSRRVNPEINIAISFVSTVLPGANPEEVESLVTIPLEDAIESVDGVEKIYSTSQDNVSFISVEFDSSIDPEKAKTDVQSAVDTVSGLPEDATNPHVAVLDFEDVPVWTFAVRTDDDIASLFRFSETLQKRIESDPLVNKVVVSGLKEQEIQVLVKPEALQEFNINPFMLSQAVKAHVDSYPAGVVGLHGTIFTLTIDPVLNSVDDVRNLTLNLGGSTFVLSDVATVMERSSPTQPKSYVADTESGGQRIVTFNVFKLQSADIDKTVAAAHQRVDEVLEEFDNRFEVISIMDAGNEIDEEFGELFNNLAATIVLVFITLFIFLGIKQATIASISIPLSFLIAFGTIQVLGLSLNFLTMFSLLLALGLVVDDAIVIISAMTSYYRTGKFTAVEAGLLVWRDYIVPIWTTTITTIWAFVPLLLSAGIIGEFIKSIPIVVTTVLLASTSVAVLITLPLMIVIVDPQLSKRVVAFFKILTGVIVGVTLWKLFAGNPFRPFIIALTLGVVISTLKFRKQLTTSLIPKYITRYTAQLQHMILKGFVNPNRISRLYERFILKILKSKRLRGKVVIIVIAFFVFSLALIPMGFVKNEFFPKTDGDLLYISIELPIGTSLSTTNTEAQEMLEEFRKIDDVDFVIADVGRGVQKGSTSTETESHIISYTLTLDKNRENTSIDIAEQLREEYADYDKGELKVVELSGGPPAGADIQLKLIGEDLNELNSLADKVVKYLEGQNSVTNVEKTIKPGAGKLSFVPDTSRLQDAGLSVQDLGLWLRTFASGFTLDKVRFTTNDEQNITFRMGTELQTPESLSSITVPTQQGSVPLESLGRLELNAKPTKITRENGKRTISVTAAAEPGFTIPEISKDLEKFAASELELPAGYEWATGGVNEENNESVTSILQAMVLAFILILGTMVVQLTSFRKSMIVLLVIPLAMSGVFIIFALTGVPLSFPALIGILALFGIVVNNSIMVVDKINLNVKIGMPFTESIADAAASRLEPIMFSSLTTIMGLLPITLSNPLWRGLGGSIIAGLFFSGTIMLLFIPVTYYLLFAYEHR